MEQWTEIHRRILVEKVSQRQVLRETGIHWKTLQKILEHSELGWGILLALLAIFLYGFTVIFSLQLAIAKRFQTLASR